MEAPVARQTHPFVIIAAIAVTLFSLVGMGAVVGWIPTSIGGGGIAPAQAPADVTEAAAQAPEPQKVQADTTKPAASKPVARAKPQPKSVARSEPREAVVTPPAPPVVVAAACRECAVIEEVREIEKDGEGSGGGAVAGGVVGGVLGHRFGSGRGNDIATVLGAVGGAVAGHQIEKSMNKTKEYQITVRYEDGSRGLFTQSTPPSWRPGDKVKIVNDAIQARG